MWTRLRVVGRGRHVAATASPVDVSVCSFWVVLVGVFWLDYEGVGTEVISLSLQQVGRQILGPVAVEEGQGGAESRCWDTRLSTEGNDVSPTLLSIVNGFVEEVVEQQVLEVGIGTVGSGDILQED